MPKYCKTCMLQGHDKSQCYVEHPELFQLKNKSNKVMEGKDKDANHKDKAGKDYNVIK